MQKDTDMCVQNQRLLMPMRERQQQVPLQVADAIKAAINELPVFIHRLVDQRVAEHVTKNSDIDSDLI